MLLTRIGSTRAALQQQIRKIGNHKTIASKEISSANIKDRNIDTAPSERMKEFHEKLKLDPPPRVSPTSMRFIDLMLVKTNPNTGELISDAEKDPTKWGDWQNGGRVSDF